MVSPSTIQRNTATDPVHRIEIPRIMVLPIKHDEMREALGERKYQRNGYYV